MTAFALNEAMPAGPPHQVMTTPDLRFAIIAAWTRCRMKSWKPELTASWTGVDDVTDEWEHVALIEFRRVEDGVRVVAPTLPDTLQLNPATYFHLSTTDVGVLMIEGAR